ncbi:MAG: NADH-quinone oxidoreductase subunit N [Anaerolineae bacterium]
MGVEISGFNLGAVAPQGVVLLTAIFVMMVDIFAPAGRRWPLALLSLAGAISAGAVSFTILGSGASFNFQDMAVADGFSAFLNLVFLVAAGLASLLSLHYVEREGMESGEYYALLLLSTCGMMVMGAATDLVTIFLGLEILSVPLYVLAAFNKKRLESGEAGLKYFLLGAFASGFFLYGIALFYGATGTTNLSGIAAFLSQAESYHDLLFFIGLGLLIVGFGFKVALVPFHVWTPDVYQGAPTPVTAFMSVGAKAAGFAALARVMLSTSPLLLPPPVGGGLGKRAGWLEVLAALAVFTIFFGNIVAIAQRNLKRMLAYSSIAHAGYILIGVVVASEGGLSALLFYLLAYAFMNIGAFAVVAALGREGEVDVELSDFAGLGYRRPFLGAAMGLFMLSLAGVPPLAGFFGKLYLFGAAVEAGFIGLAVVGVAGSVISAYFYLRVLYYMYIVPSPAEVPEPEPVPLAAGAALFLAAAGTVLLGLWPTPLLSLAQRSVIAMLGG